MTLIYRALTTVFYPFFIAIILLRKFIGKEDPTRYKEKILHTHFNVVRKKNLKLIWFHAASIGEFKSIIPIIEELIKKECFEFLITTTTLSSSNLAKNELKNFNNVHHRFFPLDVNFIIDKFLILWKPNVIFFVDSEIWPNLIFKAKKYKVPIGIINARITSKTFKRWMLFPNTAKKIFSLFNLFLTSNLETKKYLLKLNAKNIYFNGNIKLINKVGKQNTKSVNEKTLLNSRFWIAASTHEGEDDLCLKAHLKIKDKLEDIITIIAPRHIDRVIKIEKLCKKNNLNVQILSNNEKILKDKEIIIINSFGNLPEYFKYAKSVFIGKSTIKKLENVGGQNPIDAAKLGCKIYHGPYVYNFKDIYEILGKNNISKKIDNFEELGDHLIEDLKNSAKGDRQISSLINSLGQKTLNDTMNNINNFLFNEIK